MDYLMCGLYFIGGGVVVAAVILGLSFIALPFAFLDYIIHSLDGCEDVLIPIPFEERAIEA